ncbi:hypothetical protein [Novosphingobium guangzhouense]|uniref:hypothetical protein n=1 Tax=Novosphingobium guangzhouense TaxID=1850347 RepID=UPI0011AF7BA8|nr:hypothetical protein [Novosphingobium guangzhouense]
MTFGTFSLNGHEYPLGHLDPFEVTVAAKDPLASPAVLRVICSHHVFSVKWDDNEHTADHEFTYNKERRAFCPVRYGCSIEIEDIVKYHINGKAYVSKDGKGISRHLFYAVADSIPYPVVFDLAKAKHIPEVDGIMRIISAYQKPLLPARNKLQSINFARLVHQKCPPKTK